MWIARILLIASLMFAAPAAAGDAPHVLISEGGWRIGVDAAGRLWHARAGAWARINAQVPALAISATSLALADDPAFVAVGLSFASSAAFSLGALVTTRDGGVTWQSHAMPIAGQIVFDTPLRGRVTGGPDGVRVYETGDGGATWRRIADAPPPAPVAPAVSDAADAGPGLAREGVSETGTGQGFDTCRAPSLPALQAWWRASPYVFFNLYGGGLWACRADGTPSAAYVRAATAIGWRILPTWVGPQSQCWLPGVDNRISHDLSQARAQGISEANAASDWLAALGLADGGGVIYYDLESHAGSAECRAGARAFIDGWVQRVRERGHKAGVYGAACSSYLGDFVSNAHVPDAIWAAQWRTPARYQKGVPLFGLACLSDSLWANRQRIRQYSGGHAQTWGNTQMVVDANVADGPLAAGPCRTPRPGLGQVLVFADAALCGASTTLGIGAYADAAAMGLANDSASSIAVGGDVVAQLCRNADFGGGCETLGAEDLDLADNTIGNDNVSSLRVSARPANAAIPPCSDGFEPDGMRAQARVLPLNTYQDHWLCGAGDEDWVSFSVQAGASYALSAQYLTGGADPQISVFTADGATRIAFSDDAAGFEPRVVFRAATGSYVARISDATGKGANGRGYALRLAPVRRMALPWVATR